MQTINKLFEWVMKMAYLNLLWLLFSFFGLGLFGIFPAVVATFGIVRRWIVGCTNIPIFRTFWSIYRKEFIKSNIIGYLLLMIGMILIIDIRIFNASTNTFENLLTLPVLAIFFVYLLTSLYVFPIFVHYDLKIIKVLKHAFLIMIINPLQTAIMIIGLVGVSYLFWKFQGLIPLFSVSVLVTIIMMSSMKAFEKIKLEDKQQV